MALRPFLGTIGTPARACQTANPFGLTFGAAWFALSAPPSVSKGGDAAR